MTKKKRKKNKNKRVALYVLVSLLIITPLAFVLICEYSRVYEKCTVEAGVPVDVTDFLKIKDNKAYFTEESDKIDITKIGEYKLKIKTGLFTHETVLYIEDTVNPEFELKEKTIQYGKNIVADEFVENVNDATKTVAKFDKAPDFTFVGTQNISISVTDMAGNKTTKSTSIVINPTVEKVECEIGTPFPSVSDFLEEGLSGELKTDFSQITKPGTYTVDIEINGNIYQSKLLMKDTEKPVFEKANNFSVFVGNEIPYMSNIKVKDNSIDEVDIQVDSSSVITDKAGTYPVIYTATDSSGNVASATVQLTLVKDDEKPVFTKANDFSIYIGDGISYMSQVKVSDNSGSNVNVTVDTSKVVKDVAGTYPVTYTATDLAGNTATATINIIIKNRPTQQEELERLSNEVIAKIIKDGMTPYEKCEAIFNYVHNNIYYVSSSDKSSIDGAAYYALVNKKGDCFNYFSLAKILLTKAGIKNMDIEKIPDAELHYWNLVDIGDGWYHFDATRRKDGTIIFMWKDAKLMQYSKANYNSHNYDKSKYPKVN